MKKLLFTAAVAFGCTAKLFAQVPNYVPTNGLVGWWPFNGNANDESGNGNNGTVNGATLTTDRFGNLNQAYNFNGINNKIIITNSNSLQLNSQASFSLWAKIDSLNFDGTSLDYVGRFLDKSTPGGVDGFLIDCNHRTSVPNPAYYNLCSQGSSRLRSIIGGSAVLTNCFDPYSNWSHLLITFSNGTLKSYINGVFIDSTSTINMTIQQNTKDLIFGYQTTGNSNAWLNGQLDDIGIWNRALTACEIADLYNSQLGSLNTSSSQTQTALDSYTWAVNGQTYTQSGTYSDTLVNAEGCDSIVTLNLTLNYTGINELTPNHAKKLVKITDLNGKETPFKKNSILLFIYEDGTVERVYSAD